MNIRQLTGRAPTKEYLKNFLKHSLYDLRMLLFSLEDIIYYKKYDLRELYIKREIHGILRNFTSFFDGVLTSKPIDGDYSRSANLKRRLMSIKDVNFKDEMSKYLFYVLDWDTDFAPLFNMKKGYQETTDFLNKLSDWLTNHYEPYHLQMNIVDALKKLKYKVAIQDLDLLIYWIVGIEHLIKNWVDSKFQRNYPVAASNFEYMLSASSYIKSHIQKGMDKRNAKKKTKTESKKIIQSSQSKPKNGFKIQIQLHL